MTHRTVHFLAAALGALSLAGCQTAAEETVTGDPAAGRSSTSARTETPDSTAGTTALQPVAQDVGTGTAETAVVSQDALTFIIAQEIGSKTAYETRIGGKPHWDGGGSGILIGFGYNLGSASEEAFRRDWAGVLSPAALDRVAAAVGLRPTSEANKTRIRELEAFLSDIEISYDDARKIFETVMIPDHVGRARRALDNTDRLHPHSMGALVSLVYNRGATFKRDGDRFMEMRAIRTHMAAGDFAKIPDELRSMARLWPTVKHFQRRRAVEADLFQKGLDAQKTGA